VTTATKVKYVGRVKTARKFSRKRTKDAVSCTDGLLGVRTLDTVGTVKIVRHAKKAVFLHHRLPPQKVRNPN
jgi:hypothetical protein